VEKEDRINAIEAELYQTKKELNEILFDIRNYLSGMPGPAPDDEPAETRSKRG
jgi:hypothetical protein